MKMLFIAFVTGFMTQHLIGQPTEGPQTNDAIKAYRNVEERLTRARKSADLQEFVEIGRTINQLPPGTGEQATGVLEREKLALWVKFLGLLDGAVDLSFDPADVPDRNLAPPGTGGVVYDSGIDPKEIKEPEARKQYEADIKANHAKAERHSQQIGLRKMLNTFAAQAATFFRERFSGERAAVLNEMLQSEFTEADKRVRVQSLITSPPVK
jgi:hypothetical protein